MAAAIKRDTGGGPTERTLHDGTKVSVPISSAGKKVLCRRHNSALSPLDEVGRRFVAAIKSLAAVTHGEPMAIGDTHQLFNGFDVERWMLKVLCTLAHDEPASRVRLSPKWRVPASWVHILFGKRRFGNGAGLHIPTMRRGRAARGILVAKITGDRFDLTEEGVPLLPAAEPNTVLGLSIALYGWDFDLFLAGAPSDTENYHHRIRMFRAGKVATGPVAHVHLGWDEAPPSFAGVPTAELEGTQDDWLV